MADNLKICEHESVEWIFKNIPKLYKGNFFKKLPVAITALDISVDIIVIGTNNGKLYVINRKNSVMENFSLKKDCMVCQIKLIRTIDISIAIGFLDGSIYILTIPIKDNLIFDEINQFIVPVEHKSAITCVTWSKNAEKLFSGDIFGFVCCSEINYHNKTVTAYEVCRTTSKINQMAYDHKCLLISNETETFMWNFNVNKKIQIGSRERNEQGKFGVSFISKLCNIQEIDIVVIRPGGKIWISDVNGSIKRSIIMRSDALFMPDKMISLLPCFTSQSDSTYIENVKSGKTKFQFGLVTPISETDLLIWSENYIIVINVITGIIVLSAFNLGQIINVSVCDILHVIENNSNKEHLSKLGNSKQYLYEIWVFRKPIHETENRLVRLSSLPLITSSLQIDAFYFFSPPKIAKLEYLPSLDTRSENVTVSNSESILGSVEENETNSIASDTSSRNLNKWFPKLPSNMIEKTKEVMKQGQAMFKNEDEEGLEQANEVTEDGLIMTYEPSDPILNAITAELSDIVAKMSPEVIKTEISYKYPKINTRVIEIINIDESSEINDLPQPKNEFNCLNSDTKSKAILEKRLSSTSEQSTISDNFIDFFNENFLNSNNDNTFFDNESDQNGFTYGNNIIPDDNQTSINSRDSHQLSGNFSSINNSFNSNLSPDLVKSDEYLKKSDVFINNNSNKLLVDHLNQSPNQSNQSDIINNAFNNDEVSKSEPENNYLDNTIEDNSIMDSNEPEPDNVSEQQEIEVNNEVKEKKILLSNSILMKCNKWISHRGPNLSNYAKLSSLSVNSRMIWLTDTKGFLYVGFNEAESYQADDKINCVTSDKKWLWFIEPGLRTDKLASSPNGLILWREKEGDVSVYTGVTKIWTPKVVKERVLQKSNWETTMHEISEIDIDEDMAVVVTKRGELKVMNGISSRTPYKQYHSVNVTGRVMLISALNGIIWYVTEIDNSRNQKSQHIFACAAKDKDGHFDTTYWRTVPLAKDLIKLNEKNYGELGGSEDIKSIQLGTNNLAWILTIQGMCFFSQNISLDNPIGNGIWYQISLQYILQEPSSSEESTASFSMVDKIWKHSENDSRFKKCTANMLFSVKCSPRKSKGNGLLWLTCAERNSPCILYESAKNILGHCWFDCFSPKEIEIKKFVGLPSAINWSNVEVAANNTLWLLHKYGELFCYWNECKIRSVPVQSAFGKIIKISARNNAVVVLTSKSKVLIRIGILDCKPMGSDWREINKRWNQNEIITDISCSDREIWLVTENNVYYNENIELIIDNPSKQLPWNLLNFNSTGKKLCCIENVNSGEMNHIWGISNPEGFIYMSSWQPLKNEFVWMYISGPRAKSIHVSGENLWIIEQTTGSIFCRCGIDWKHHPTGDYWVHVPVVTKQVIDLAVSPQNEVFVIDIFERLLVHRWTMIDNSDDLPSTTELKNADIGKTEFQDWELLN